MVAPATQACRNQPRCLHNSLGKISLQHFKGRIPFQAAMRLHGIVEIHKAAQFTAFG